MTDQLNILLACIRLDPPEDTKGSGTLIKEDASIASIDNILEQAIMNIQIFLSHEMEITNISRNYSIEILAVYLQYCIC